MITKVVLEMALFFKKVTRTLNIFFDCCINVIEKFEVN